MDQPFLMLGQLFTFLHFFILVVLFPLTGFIEMVVYQALYLRHAKN